MKKYKLIGEILSPLHIGTGSEIEFFDYLIKNGKFYKIIFNDFFLNLEESEKNKLITLINQNRLLEIRKFMTSIWDSQRFPFEYSCAVSEEVNKLYISNINNIENQLLINPFIRTTTKKDPYLPGSSLKGAIRTALINELAKNKQINTKKADKIEGNVLDCLNNWGRLNPTRDPFRAIKIKDAYLSSDDIMIAKVVHIKKDKFAKLKPRGMQIFAELTYSTLSGKRVKFETELAIDNTLQKTNFIKRKIDIGLIKNSCNSFYLDKLNYEIKGFYKNTTVEKVYSLISTQKFADNSFLLRVGRFSGLESVTLDKYREPKSSLSRNLCEMKYPFGWIKLDYQEV